MKIAIFTQSLRRALSVAGLGLCVALGAARADSLYSVGIGPFPAASGYDAAFMGRLALVGGTAPVGCDPASSKIDEVCHYQVTPGADPSLLERQLGAALDAIRTTVVCP